MGDAAVIIECALNGQTKKAENAHTPRSAEELARAAVACIDRGASIIHTHIDDPFVPGDEAAAQYLDHYLPILAARPGAMLYPTICAGATAAEKLAHVPVLVKRMGLRIGLFEPGSVNVGGIDHDGLPRAMDFVYANSPADIAEMARLCAKFNLRASVSIFEPGWMRCFLAYWRAGALPDGLMLKIYLGGEYGYMAARKPGLNFGLPAEPWALDVYLRMLGDCPAPWMVGVVGGDVIASGLARHAILRGGHVRVGLEDYAGDDTPTNEALVDEAARLVRSLGRQVASLSDTSATLRCG